MIKQIKQHRRYFRPLYSGEKPFDIRKDEGYKVGQKLWYREWDDIMGSYTGRNVYLTITYIYKGNGQYGLAPGYCVLGLKVEGE